MSAAVGVGKADRCFLECSGTEEVIMQNYPGCLVHRTINSFHSRVALQLAVSWYP